jgi:hypothetical protein
MASNPCCAWALLRAISPPADRLTPRSYSVRVLLANGLTLLSQVAELVVHFAPVIDLQPEYAAARCTPASQPALPAPPSAPRPPA